MLENIRALVVRTDRTPFTPHVRAAARIFLALTTKSVNKVPLVSYIKISLTFWYYASLSSCCQNLEKKNWGHRKNLGESQDQIF